VRPRVAALSATGGAKKLGGVARAPRRVLACRHAAWQPQRGPGQGRAGGAFGNEGSFGEERGMLGRKLAAEFLGTAWLVFGGCGSAVLASAFPDVGIGLLGVSLAFGLTVLTMAYAIGHISGCHLNPAVSLGLLAGGRFRAGELIPYVLAQVAGGLAGAGVLYIIASGQPGFVAGGFASNGYAEHSPGGYSAIACFVAEAVLTMFFLLIIMGSTDKRAPAGFAPIAIGFALTLIHLIGIPVTNLSVNPARSTGPAFFVGGWAVSQLWMFWVAPILGAIVGGLIYRSMAAEDGRA
jgi:aquaporin Z